MTDVARDKYVRLMTEIDDLEDRVEELEKAIAGGGGAEVQKELDELRERLADRMWELARITDACKKIHVRR
jgi:cell division septum initiation protein DivIVA